MNITKNLQSVQSLLRQHCQSSGRADDSVQLIAVSKTKPVSAILEAYRAGQVDFAENYLQEAVDKVEQLYELTDPAIIWHYIGSIQSNKTRKISEHFHWVHTVDSFKIARRLSEQRPDNLPVLNICLQINIDNDPNKSGLAPNQQSLLALCQKIVELPNVRLRGLMCIPALTADKAQTQASFERMALLKTTLNEQGVALDTLSMGMSGDLKEAVFSGTTMVRIGSAIFGARD